MLSYSYTEHALHEDFLCVYDLRDNISANDRAREGFSATISTTTIAKGWSWALIRTVLKGVATRGWLAQIQEKWFVPLFAKKLITFTILLAWKIESQN